ncbi:hypothetical protein A4H97_17145 [Niastella yeongjuensis]|uniref:Outer membrane protein beta-barrel domain-containing protein n=1 Tax=Niastella yeongjuensis TaxID=354355 RepID=A0A1V9E1E2_9BACT|nr:hypothetical protein [Niastella yeongjuensis]OQP39943.1 hypothetical protein A4H97_17145 [Niastella yeongjuensis]SEO11111.1 hypothetical protein SAMN05660816_02173 [Niastella yeongjuensis]
MKLKVLLAGFILWSCCIQAQNMVSTSSIHAEADTLGVSKKELAIRYPGLRQFNISANSFGYSDFDAKLNDKNFAGGKVKTERISASINTPAIKWKGNALSATIYYTYTSLKLKDITNELSDEQLAPLTTNNNTIDLALNYSRSDRIFNHQFIYSLVARGISDGINSVRRFNFNGSLCLPLVRKENTTFSVGLLVLIDPSSPIPVEPIVNYYHKFTSSGIELIVDLPNGINVKKEVAKNAWLMVGSNQQSYSTFYNQHNSFLNGKISYNTIELKNGVAFEYLFVKNIMLSIRQGVNNILSSKIFRNGEDYGSASITSKNKIAAYVNVSLSLLSF